MVDWLSYQWPWIRSCFKAILLSAVCLGSNLTYKLRSHLRDNQRYSLLLVQTSQVEFSLFSLLLVQGNGVVVPKKKKLQVQEGEQGCKLKCLQLSGSNIGERRPHREGEELERIGERGSYLSTSAYYYLAVRYSEWFNLLLSSKCKFSCKILKS